MGIASSRRENYRSAVTRATKWILSHQQDDGSFGPVETMGHYMVLGTALLYMGHADAACRLMPVLKRLFVKEDGSFDPPEIRAGHKWALLDRGYPPSWVIYSAHLNLAYDVSLPAMPHLLKLQDQQSGGMFGTLEDAESGKGIVNCAVTCVAGQAAVTTGYLNQARRMGDHLVDNLIARNPDLVKAFYPVWDTEAGLRTDKNAPESPNMPRVLQRFEPGQGHFLTGMMMAFLTDLYRVTREGKYLDAALLIYDFAAGGTPAIYESTASHKFAWGCAWLYRETGRPEHLESACRVCDYLVRIQEANGSFVHRAYVATSAEWPYSPRLNITGQFALWISRTLNLL